MNIQFKKGTIEYLDDCVKAMEHSTLSNAYFQTEESRKNAVMEGLSKEPGSKDFYEKLGYKQVGTIPSLYRKGIDEYLMMKVPKSDD